MQRWTIRVEIDWGAALDWAPREGESTRWRARVLALTEFASRRLRTLLHEARMSHGQPRAAPPPSLLQGSRDCCGGPS